MNTCRFCRAPLTKSFIDLGRQPVSNDYLSQAQLDAGNEPTYPLHVWTCEACLLVQAEDPVAHDAMFTADYAYFSSFSEAWLKHCQAFAAMAVNRFDLGPESQVVEVASNDGYLLQYFVQKGVPVLGVEPAANVAEVARKKGVPTEVRFFGVETAKILKEQGHAADLMLGNNVLAHVPDINDFVGGMKVLLKAGGEITMEFPHLLQLMQNNQFDTIYHEHFSYLSFITVDRIFAKHGMKLFDVEEISTHGGSLRIFACHAEDARPLSMRVGALRQKEITAGLDKIETYVTFGEQVKETKRKLLEFLVRAKRTGKTVAGYGAPAKGNTLLNYCGVRTDLIDFTVDRSPHKQGKFLPGVHIPILSPEAIKQNKPDYVLILPWNLKDEVVSQISFIKEWGGQFVVPIPEVKLVA